jgi:hypothetical protein
MPSQAATASGPADTTVPNPAATVTATAAASDLHLIFTAPSFPHNVDLAETVNQACDLKFLKIIHKTCLNGCADTVVAIDGPVLTT